MATSVEEYLHPVKAFLACETPQQWIDYAAHPDQLPKLLADHANCELKAAQTAQSVMWKYGTPRPGQSIEGGSFQASLLNKLSKLAREELRHFEQVLKVMKQLDVPYVPIPAARYAVGMLEIASRDEPQALVDKLIIGAFIEARSCERFAKLADRLPKIVGDFYISLLKSESRHFSDYLALAEQVANGPIASRIEDFRQREAELINSVDKTFRFHSGIPYKAVA